MPLPSFSKDSERFLLESEYFVHIDSASVYFRKLNYMYSKKRLIDLINLYQIPVRRQCDLTRIVDFDSNNCFWMYCTKTEFQIFEELPKRLTMLVLASPLG